MSVRRFPLVLAIFLLFPAAANAQKLRIDAAGTSYFGNFSIVFEDDGDGLLQHDEILYFSGVSGETPGSGLLSYDGIAYVPDIPGIATESGGTTNANGPCTTCWEFTPSNFGEDSDGWFTTRWSYVIGPYDEPSRPMTFSYEFVGRNDGADGNPWAAGAVLSGSIRGTIMPDDDTVIVDSFGAVTLDRPGLPLFVYDEIERDEFNSLYRARFAQMSFSGPGNDFRSCPEGFDPQFPTDCSFSSSPGGGFLIAPSGSGGIFATAADGSDQAVCPGPSQQAGCRVTDFPFSPDRWSLTIGTPADDCTVEAGGCNPTGLHEFALPEGFVVPPGGEITQIVIPVDDSRADLNGRCDGQTPLVLFDGDLIIPPYLCGSPDFRVILTEANFFVPEGTIDSEVFPEAFVSNPYDCNVPITGDPQMQSAFVWQPTNGGDVIEGTAIELTNGCDSSRGRMRGFSYIVVGLHIDFGLDWDADPQAVTQAFIDLTSSKFDTLVQAVIDARRALKRKQFFRLWATASLARVLHHHGRHHAAARIMRRFLRLTERSRFRLNEEINHEGNLLSRGDNIRFLLDEYIVPFAPRHR